MTPEQAAVWATVQTQMMHQSDPLTMWLHLVKSKGADIQPTAEQLLLIGRLPPHRKDPVHTRLRRLEAFPKMGDAASRYTRERHSQPYPFAVLGTSPDDYPGQCSLVYHLAAKFTYWDIGVGFSIPMAGLSERLLVGEQLVDDVDALVVRIINEVK